VACTFIFLFKKQIIQETKFEACSIFLPNYKLLLKQAKDSIGRTQKVKGIKECFTE